MYYRSRQDSAPDKDGNYLWRPEFVRTGKVIDTRDLAKILSTATTLTIADIAAVLLILPEFMNLYLKEGHTVKLDGLGSFILYGRTTGKGVLTKEEISTRQFNSVICKFTPEYTVEANGNRTRTLTDGIELIHIDRIAKKANIGSDNSGDSGDGGGGWQDPDA